MHTALKRFGVEMLVSVEDAVTWGGTQAGRIFAVDLGIPTTAMAAVDRELAEAGIEPGQGESCNSVSAITARELMRAGAVRFAASVARRIAELEVSEHTRQMVLGLAIDAAGTLIECDDDRLVELCSRLWRLLDVHGLR